MSERVLVIGAHADDEVLGCGGALLKHRAAGDTTGWLLGTFPAAPLFDDAYIARRRKDLVAVKEAFGMSYLRELGHAAAGLDRVPFGDLIADCAAAVAEFKPDIVYVVHRNDVHSDHRYLHDAAWAALKPLRGRTARRVLAYETLSSTNLAVPAQATAFVPQAYCDITDYLDRKVAIFGIYETETQKFPSPRSLEAIVALARYRGSAVHFAAAEAFAVLRDTF